MACKFSIPILGNAVGTHVRIEIAISSDAGSPPGESSQSWVTQKVVANSSLPTTVETIKVPEGQTLWYRASAEANGARASNYTTPDSITCELGPGFTNGFLVPGDPTPHEVHWTENAATGGVLIEWAIDPYGLAEPNYAYSAQVDATDGQYDISDVLPEERQLWVRITAYELFDGEAVDGDVGGSLVFHLEGLGDDPETDVPDPVDGLDCRVIFDSNLELVVDSNYCLVLANP